MRQFHIDPLDCSLYYTGKRKPPHQLRFLQRTSRLFILEGSGTFAHFSKMLILPVRKMLISVLINELTVNFDGITLEKTNPLFI
jgi:hypothetical protein